MEKAARLRRLGRPVAGGERARRGRSALRRAGRAPLPRRGPARGRARPQVLMPWRDAQVWPSPGQGHRRRHRGAHRRHAGFTLVGLPDASLAEARDRVRAAVLVQRGAVAAAAHHGEPVARGPAQGGSHFDLGVAVAVGAAGEDLPRPGRPMNRSFPWASSARRARLRPVPGVLPAVLAAAAPARRMSWPDPMPVRPGAPGVAEIEALAAPGAGRAARRAGGRRAGGLAGGRHAAQAGDGRDAGRPRRCRRPAGRQARRGGGDRGSPPPDAHRTTRSRQDDAREATAGTAPQHVHRRVAQVSAIHSVAGVLPTDKPLIIRPPFADPHHRDRGRGTWAVGAG